MTFDLWQENFSFGDHEISFEQIMTRATLGLKRNIHFNHCLWHFAGRPSFYLRLIKSTLRKFQYE